MYFTESLHNLDEATSFSSVNGIRLSVESISLDFQTALELEDIIPLMLRIELAYRMARALEAIPVNANTDMIARIRQIIAEVRDYPEGKSVNKRRSI